MRQNNYYKQARSQLKEAKQMVQNLKQDNAVQAMSRAILINKKIKQKNNRFYYYLGNRWLPIKKTLLIAALSSIPDAYITLYDNDDLGGYVAPAGFFVETF